MNTKERTQIGHHPQLDLEFLQAFYVEHVFSPRVKTAINAILALLLALIAVQIAGFL